MRIDLIVHIIAGSLAIIAGFIALFVAKGAGLHRRSGQLFVYSMLTMSIVGAGMAAFWNAAPAANVPAGMLTAYLVVTGLTTVSPPSWWSRRLDIMGLVLALLFALVNLSMGVATVMFGFGQSWMRFPFFVFGTIALLAMIGDWRMIRVGSLRGSKRLARHLWRMCFALFIASGSFFLGQADVFPKPIRIYPLLAIPAFLPIVMLLYWMWRVRMRNSLRGISTASRDGVQISMVQSSAAKVQASAATTA